MPANAVCQAYNAALFIPVSDGADPVKCALKTKSIVLMKWASL